MGQVGLKFLVCYPTDYQAVICWKSITYNKIKNVSLIRTGQTYDVSFYLARKNLIIFEFL